ncbi:MAG TPA: hypothetical protein VFV33_19875 [Gemmatimonadaceae bacterium]|nr:hypothetical protein [Gemmatimonadaceae bacterium]
MTAPHASSREALPPLGWLVKRAPLSEEALGAIGGAADGDSLLSALLSAGHVVDAVRLVASALPPREGVWWAWTAATHAARLAPGGSVAPPVAAALAATERWIATPDEAHRRAVWEAAQGAGLDTPAGSAAGAAYLTGGSIAPPELAPIPPPPGIHATLAFSAVVAASAVDLEQFDAVARAFVAQGVEIIRQLGGWESSIAHARSHHDLMLQQHLAVAAPPAPHAAPAASSPSPA